LYGAADTNASQAPQPLPRMFVHAEYASQLREAPLLCNLGPVDCLPVSPTSLVVELVLVVDLMLVVVLVVDPMLVVVVIVVSVIVVVVVLVVSITSGIEKVWLLGAPLPFKPTQNNEFSDLGSPFTESNTATGPLNAVT